MKYCTLLSELFLRGSTGPVDSREHTQGQGILSAPGQCFTMLISYHTTPGPRTHPPSHDPPLRCSQRQGLHSDESAVTVATGERDLAVMQEGSGTRPRTPPESCALALLYKTDPLISGQYRPVKEDMDCEHTQGDGALSRLDKSTCPSLFKETSHFLHMCSIKVEP